MVDAVAIREKAAELSTTSLSTKHSTSYTGFQYLVVYDLSYQRLSNQAMCT